VKTKQCNTCIHFNQENIIATTFLNIFDNFKMISICKKGHKPKHYTPESPLDFDDGYKRKCEDYEQK